MRDGLTRMRNRQKRVKEVKRGNVRAKEDDGRVKKGRERVMTDIAGHRVYLERAVKE